MPDDLSKEEKVFLTRALWKALQAPEWAKDDLIDFGKAIFSKSTLKAMDDRMYERIYPFLERIVASLGQQLAERLEAVEHAEQTQRVNGSAEPEAAAAVEAVEEEKVEAEGSPE
jgi:predicted alpha-1,6-mannanase (GH76 family)